MTNLWNRFKDLLRKKPATVSGTLTLILSNLIVLEVFSLSPEKQAAITSLITVAVMVLANVVSPTEPVVDTYEDTDLEVQEEL
jgi:hypothetical protein